MSTSMYGAVRVKPPNTIVVGNPNDGAPPHREASAASPELYEQICALIEAKRPPVVEVEHRGRDLVVTAIARRD